MDIDILHHFSDGLYAKETRIPAGRVLVQHKHAYAHLSVLASGTVEVDVDGVRSTHTGPACLDIKANIHHGVKALTDVVWFCIHATDCADPGAVDEVLSLPGDQAEMVKLAQEMSA